MKTNTTKTTTTKPSRRSALAAVAQRLREPSTMAGLSALAVIAGAPPGVPEVAMQGFAALLAALAIFMPEKSAP